MILNGKWRLWENSSGKLLGMQFNWGLTWGNQIDHIYSKGSLLVFMHYVTLFSLNLNKSGFLGPKHSHFQYWLWGICAKYKLNRVSRLKNKTNPIIAKLNSQSRAWRPLGLLTLRSIFEGGCVLPIGPD